MDGVPMAPGAPAQPAEVEDEFWTDAPPPSDEGAAGQPPAAPATEPAAPGSAPAQPAAPSAAQPVISAPPIPASPPAAQPATAAPPAPAAPATPATPTRWVFQADGNEIEVEGSELFPDGSIKVPKETAALLQELVAEGAAHRGSWREQQEGYTGRIAELEAQLANPSAEEVKARAYNEQLLALLAKGPEAVAEWLDNYQTNFPVFQAKAEQAVLRQQLDARERRATELEARQAAQDLTPKLNAAISGAVEQFKAKYPGVDAQKLHQRIVTKFIDNVAYEVQATERTAGLKPGEQLIGRGPKGSLYIVNTGLIGEEFEYQAGLVQSSAAAAQAAVSHNAAMSAPAATVPPAVPAAGGAPPADGGAPAGELPKSKEEAEEWIKSGRWRKTMFPNS